MRLMRVYVSICVGTCNTQKFNLDCVGAIKLSMTLIVGFDDTVYNNNDK